MINTFFNDESGQTLVEYGLLISLLALTAVVAITIFGKKTSGMWGNNTELYPTPPPPVQ